MNKNNEVWYCVSGTTGRKIAPYTSDYKSKPEKRSKATWLCSIVVVILLTTLLASCASSNYYKGCDGKKKFKTQMN